MPLWSRERRYALLVALLALVVVAGPAVAQTDQQVSPFEDDLSANVTMDVQLQQDGDAVWTVSTTIPLSSDEKREAFREFAAEYEDGQHPAPGLRAFERASEQASDATGREMTITDERRITAGEDEIANGTGRVGVEFTWTNFARTEGDRLSVDDVLVTDDGLWLSGLDAGDELVFRPPDGYGVLEANVVPGANATLRWSGPAEFSETSLEVTFIGNGNGDDGVVGPDDTTDGPQQPTEPSPLPWLVGGSAVLVAIAVLAYFAGRDRLPVPDTSAENGQSPVQEPRPETDQTEASDETTAAGTAGDTSDTDDDVDVELLSDEERVTRLLEANGGRMKQATIVKETDWSNAKVSQLLSQMEEEGKIDKLRIGRENLISFPDEDVTDVTDN